MSASQSTSQKSPFAQLAHIATKAPKADLIAGLTLWGMIVPEAVAYAGLAGAPAQAGLYTIMIMLPIYAIFASSNFVVATSTAAVSATVAGILAVAASDVSVSLPALVVAVGIIYLLMGHFKLGFLANFISEPVNRGFIFGLALFIAMSQLPKIFGISGVSGNFFERGIGLLQNLGSTNIASLLLGAVLLGFLFLIEKLRPNWPGGLIATALAMLLSYLLKLETQFGVEMVGALPNSLPTPVLPLISISDLAIIVPGAIGIAILGMSEEVAVSKKIAVETRQPVNENRQLTALGWGNLAGGFFGALPGTGSMSSTSVNRSAGAQTQMTSVYAAIVTCITVLFFSGLFAYLPEPFLGALIIHAISKNLLFRDVKAVRKYSRTDYYLAVIACFNVLIFDVLAGLLLSMALNLVFFAYQGSKLRIEKLGRVDGNPHFLAKLGRQDVVALPDNVLAIGIAGGAVFYASAAELTDYISKQLRNNKKIDTVVLSAQQVDFQDFTTIAELKNLEPVLKAHGAKLYVTNLVDEGRYKTLESAGFNNDQIEVVERLDLTKLGTKAA